jgi:hypothetical protein
MSKHAKERSVQETETRVEGGQMNQSLHKY